MTINPLVQAHAEARRMTGGLDTLFAKMGTGDHPRGAVLTAYRNARLALQAKGVASHLPTVTGVLGQLRESVTTNVRGLLGEALGLGARAAVAQLAAFGITARAVTDGSQIGIGLTAATAQMERQVTAATAMLASGADIEMVIGNDAQIGVLQPASVTKDAAYWLTWLAWLGFKGVVGRYGGDRPWYKQAIATLDDKTTDCCLKVHGQIQPLHKDFHLTGEPRYADYLPGPGFHWWCRSAVSLYQEEFDLGLTDRMRESAAVIVAERAAGGSGYRHPVSALTK